MPATTGDGQIDILHEDTGVSSTSRRPPKRAEGQKHVSWTMLKLSPGEGVGASEPAGERGELWS